MPGVADHGAGVDEGERRELSGIGGRPCEAPGAAEVVDNCSGTAGIDPVAGAIAEGIEAQTEQALRNLQAVLTAAGTSMSNLVKTTIFYANVEDFATINQVDAQHLPDPPPARSAPANVVLPHGLLISVDAVATTG
jgi:2-iminobutanoate/2-iminopropanoate deaminase